MESRSEHVVGCNGHKLRVSGRVYREAGIVRGKTKYSIRSPHNNRPFILCRSDDMITIQVEGLLVSQSQTLQFLGSGAVLKP